ncbi:restriction endonuclease subunit S [Lactobacillus iners]|uniref:restriction endonuclease subunit S n=2 Tax=Lactobacillus iners TaxID=147802 RepID=UPI0036F47D22
METWKTMTLSDVCYISSSKRIFAKEYQSSGIPFYRGKEIIEKHNGISISNKLFISSERYEEIKNKFGVPLEGDILLTSVGTLGIPWLVDKEKFYFKDGNLTWLRNNELITPRFLYYWLITSQAQNQINSKCIGSTQKALTIEILKKFYITFPDIKTQKKITSIIESIELKIDNNRKINKNLEEQAQAIFKSWFVDFEPFGGIQPSEMQFIPLQELCKVVTKGTTPTTLGKSFTSTGINFIKAESILDNHSIDSSKFAFIDEETNALLKRSVIKANDIVFTIAGTLGRFAMVDNSVLPANTNQAVAIIRPDETKVTPAYLYSFFIGNWHNEYYSKRIQQAVQANLSLTTIKSLPIAVLKNTTMNNYDKLVSPLFALMKSNEEENRRLSKLRDTLLPRLMSGELDVSNLDL